MSANNHHPAGTRATQPSIELTPARCESGIRVGTPVQFRWLAGIVKTILILNLFDAILTLAWIHSGFATEANPLLATIVVENAVMFVVGKISLVSLGTVLLWRHRERPLAVIGIFGAFLVYYAILLYHISFASFLLGQLFGS